MSTTREDVAAVVVGIDGSREATNAARWAAAEAVNRGVPLRIVHAVPSRTEQSCFDTALLRAQDVASQAQASVCVDLARIVGEPGDVLVAESRRAAMVCIGSRQSRFHSESFFGPTAKAVAERAHCPVAIIRSTENGETDTGGVVSVVLSDDADNDEVVHLAMHEGRLRGATVQQIDQRTDSWVRRYPDVDVEIVAGGAVRPNQDVTVTQPHNRVQLAVIGRAEADKLTSRGALNCYPISGYPNCSVLVVRN